MELRDLHYFLSIVQAGTLTKAAQHLNITQPALSRNIKALEAELGVVLIDRHHTPITLTTDGIFLAKQAEKLLTLAADTVAGITHSHEIVGTLNIGAGETPLFKPIVTIINTIQQAHPTVNINLVSGTAYELLAQLQQGTLDFLLALDFTQKSAFNFIDLPLTNQRGVYLNINHPLSAQTAITSDQLKQYPLALAKQSAFKDAVIADLGFPLSELHIKLTYNLFYNVSFYAQLNTELMIVGLAGFPTPSDLKFIPFKPKQTSTATIVWLNNRPLTPIQQLFVTALQQWLTTN